VIKNNLIKKSAIVSLFFVSATLVWTQYSKNNFPKNPLENQIEAEMPEVSMANKLSKADHNDGPIAHAEINAVENSANIKDAPEQVIKIKLPPGKRLYNEEAMNEVASDANIESLNHEDDEQQNL
jgi:hypothetical protein